MFLARTKESLRSDLSWRSLPDFDGVPAWLKAGSGWFFFLCATLLFILWTLFDPSLRTLGFRGDKAPLVFAWAFLFIGFGLLALHYRQFLLAKLAGTLLSLYASVVLISQLFSVVVQLSNPSWSVHAVNRSFLASYQMLWSEALACVAAGLWLVFFSNSVSSFKRVAVTLGTGSFIASAGVISLSRSFLLTPDLHAGHLLFTLAGGALLLLGAFLLYLSYLGHRHLVGPYMWSWLLMPLGIGLLMFTVVFVNFLVKQQNQRMDVDKERAISLIEANLNMRLNERVSLADRMGRNWGQYFKTGYTFPMVNDSARVVTNDYPDIKEIHWFDAGGEERWSFGTAEGEASLRQQGLVLPALSMEEGRAVIATRWEKKYLLIRPVQNGAGLVMVLDVKKFFETLPKNSLPDSYWIRISDEEGRDLYQNYGDQDVTPSSDHSDVNAYPIHLNAFVFFISIDMSATNPANELGYFPFFALAAGLITSALLVWAYWLASIGQVAQRKIKEKNEALNAQVEAYASIEKELRKTQSELEGKIADRTEELTRSNQELEQYAFISSHDLQEPIRKVSNYIDLLVLHSRGTLTPEAQNDIDRIQRAVFQMKLLLNDLMKMIRLRRDNAPLEEVDLAEEVRQALATVEHAEEVQITVDPLPHVLGNRLQFRQLFHNLISNAVKFRRKDGPIIHISAHQEGENWVVSVRDNGIGIDQAAKDRIFEIFQRLRPREYPGSGMGLAICKKIVESHHGHIWVESAPAFGSTFRFTVPVNSAGEKVENEQGYETTIG